MSASDYLPEANKKSIKSEAPEKSFNRRNRGNFRRKGNQKPSSIISRSKFKGDTEDLDGHIFDVGAQNQAEMFGVTLKKLASYAGRKYTEAQDIRQAIETLKEVVVPKPVKLTGGDEDINKIILTREADAFIKRKTVYCQNTSSMFSVVLGQCTDPLKAKLEGE